MIGCILRCLERYCHDVLQNGRPELSALALLGDDFEPSVFYHGTGCYN